MLRQPNSVVLHTEMANRGTEIRGEYELMATGTYFVRPCPTCGRQLEVRIELLGRTVACQHCGAEFFASQRAESAREELRIEDLLARARQYIDSVETLDAAAHEAF